MTRYPILFNRRELVEGNGFIAGVTFAGRALLTDEDGAYWVEGINPGGLAAKGETLGEALSAFATELRLVLFDVVAEAESFEGFKREVEKLFDDTSQPALFEWNEAVQAVRQGRLSADWLGKRPADSPLGVKVEQVRQPKAANNQEGQAAIAA